MAKTAPLPKLAEMADELGQIEKNYAIAIAPLEQQLKRAKVLEAAIKLACPAAPNEEWSVEGRRFQVKLGACANQRTIDFKKLVTKISLKAFAKFATCTLDALQKHVAPDVCAEVITSAPTGPRKVTTLEKGVAAAA